MNKLLKLTLCAVVTGSLFLMGCNPTVTPEQPVTPEAPSTPENKPPVVKEPTGYSEKIDCSNKSWEILTRDLSAYAEKEVKITFSTKIAVLHKTNSDYNVNLKWQINHKVIDSETNEEETKYPVLFDTEISKTWTTVSETKVIELGKNPIFYLSTYGINENDLNNLTVYLKDFSLSIVPTDIKSWTDESVPSLKETYSEIFDSIGIAAEYGNFGLKQNGSDKYTATYTQEYWGTPTELYYEEIQNGIAKHANSITLGNELKPSFLLQWWGNDCNNTLIDFTDSAGTTIKVPNKLNGEKLIYATLNVAKNMGVQMRGHVLTWHAQTDEAFYREDYKKDGALVDKATMTARHEWYIKTVLGCVDAWEAANGYGTGNHIIWAWDVVNEAMADDAGNTYTGTNQNWLRGSTAGTKDKSPTDNPQGSRWYQIYGNEEFIINAFRFANKYAPSDVKLCYNDYNEYMDYAGGWKTSAICHIAELVKANSEARLDVIAMQSHVGISWPGVAGYENALKRFLEIADVHVSELDFSASTQAEATTAYGEYFKMLSKYGKKSSGAHKITNVTIWGINNETSWINPAHSGGAKTYPLLFNLVNNVDEKKKEVTYDTGVESLPQYDVGDTYEPNDAFWAVINAAE